MEGTFVNRDATSLARIALIANRALKRTNPRIQILRLAILSHYATFFSSAEAISAHSN